MAQPSTSVSTAPIAIGLCAVTFKGGASIRILEMETGYLVAYDRNCWTSDQIEQFLQTRFGAYELVQPEDEAVA